MSDVLPSVLDIDLLDDPSSVFHRVTTLVRQDTPDARTLRFGASAQGNSMVATEVRGGRFMKATPRNTRRDLTLTFDFVHEQILRVRLGEGTLLTRQQPFLMETSWGDVPVTRAEGAAPLHCLRDMGAGRGLQMGMRPTPYVDLSSGALRARIWTDPYRLELYDATDRLVMAADGPEQSVFCQNDDPGLSRVMGEGRLQQLFTTSLDLREDEAIYGYGERFDAFGRQRRELKLHQCDALGTTTPRSYKNVPFFCSSRGYGVFISTCGDVRACIGSRAAGKHVICVDDDLLEYYIIHGPDPSRILDLYTQLTGRAPVPPFWSFGVWMSRLTYRSEQEAEAVVDEMHRRDLGIDVLHLDPGWMDAKDWRCTLRFDTQAFPNPRDFAGRMRAKHVRLCLWQLPYIERESSLHAELASEAVFAAGTPFAETVIDYSKPAAVQTMRRRFESLFAIGVSVIKTDFGEEVPVTASLAAGSGRFLHNLYPFLYNQAVFNFTKEATGDGLVWARSAWAGSQRFPIHWGGDASSTFSNLAQQVTGALNLGMCGFTYWSSDIAGISGEATPRLYVRWAQFGMLNSHVRFHSGYPVEPWNYGGEAEQIVHDWIDLRYRLLPYIYAQARIASDSGLPLMRPMALVHPQDRNVRDLDDQYYFGTDMIVAPLLDNGDQRDAYLPAGDWYDLFTGELHQSRGQWVHWLGGLSTMPLYIRAGATLPIGPRRRHTGDSPCGQITLLHFPGPVSTAFAAEPGEMVTINARPDGGGRFSLRVTGRVLDRAWRVAVVGRRSSDVDMGPLLQHAHDVATLEPGEEWQTFNG